jgi:hypothetical protein
MLAQALRVLPALLPHFGSLAIHVTDVTPEAALAPWRAAGAHIRRAPPTGHRELGRARRGALAAGLEQPGDMLLFCDLDRLLHWAEFFAAELVATLRQAAGADCTVLGRTPRAFASHPAPQRATEAIVNEVFARVAGRAWDVTAAARALSRAAAQAIVAGYADDGIGSDAGWPLFAERQGYTLGYIETDGLEFETPDRYGDQIAAAGGLAAWMEQIDGRLDEWMLRLEIAREEIAALAPYDRAKAGI